MTVFTVLLLAGLILGPILSIAGIALATLAVALTAGLIYGSLELPLPTVLGHVALSAFAIQLGYFLAIVGMVSLEALRKKMSPPSVGAEADPSTSSNLSSISRLTSKAIDSSDEAQAK